PNPDSSTGVQPFPCRREAPRGEPTQIAPAASCPSAEMLSAMRPDARVNRDQVVSVESARESPAVEVPNHRLSARSSNSAVTESDANAPGAARNTDQLPAASSSATPCSAVATQRLPR